MHLPRTAIDCGPFELHEPIARGGMAEVWRGIHRAQQVPVAVKVITAEKGDDPIYRQSFQQEVQAVAALGHPNIVSLFDYGALPAEAAQASDGRLSAGSPYLAMEYAGAGTLRDRGVVTSWSDVRAVLLSLLDALSYAHARDVIHRDLKPENVLLSRGADGRIHCKLSDFGIAHAFDRTGDPSRSDAFAATAGTPEFMAPEQLQGFWRDFGPWTDLYALGCVTYELVYGRPPFIGDNFIAIGNQHLDSKPVPLEPRFEVPEDLWHWIRRLLRKRPHDRYVHAADAAWALEELPPLLDGAGGGADAAASAELFAWRTVLDPTQPDRSSTRLTSPTLRGTPQSFTGSAIEQPPRRAGLRLREPADPDSSGLFPMPPPFPQTWQREEAGGPDARLVGAGLRLFGLREVPFVDRQAERDAIWNDLGQVIERCENRVVVLQGASGTGKSHLARWMALRANEMGVASILRSAHTRHGGPREGLPEIVHDAYRLWGMDRDAAYRRIREILRAEVTQSTRDDLALDEQARALTELAFPLELGDESSDWSNTQSQFHFSSPESRFVPATDLLRVRAVQRPLIVWIDDAQWGAEAIQWVEHVLESQPQLPVLFVLTVQQEALDDLGLVDEMVDRLCDHERARRLTVAPLGSKDQRQLIEQMLVIEPALVDEILARTEGRPLFAVQLLGDWIERGLLTDGLHGFRLRPDADYALPDDIHELWTRRIERLVTTSRLGHPDVLRSAIEIAAALGHRVDAREWHAACSAAGLVVPDGLVAELVEAGLARRGGEGAWSFVHGMLRESLERSARHSGRWSVHNRRCAEVLAELYSGFAEETAWRRAEHLVEAGALVEALRPMFEAARYAASSGNFHVARRCLEQRAELIERVADGAETVWRVQNQWLASQLERASGHIERAHALADNALEVARQHGWTAEIGPIANRKAVLLADAGDPACLDLLDEAEEHLRAHDQVRELATVELIRGLFYDSQGQRSLARAHHESCVGYLEQAGDEAHKRYILARIAFLDITEGRFESARSICEEVLLLAEAAGDQHAAADMWNNLGEIARFEGKWREARRCYQKYLDLRAASGSRQLHTVRLNLAMVELGEGRHRSARRQLEQLRERFEDVQIYHRLPIVDLSLAFCAAAEEEWGWWDKLIVRAAEVMDEHPAVDRDSGWMAEMAADVALDRGEPERAREALEVALAAWRHLGHDEEAARIVARLDALDAG